MKKILFVHQSSSVGGGSYCLLNVVKALDTTKWEPLVVLQSEGPLVDELRRIGVDVIIFSQLCQIPYNQPLLRLSSIKAYFSVLRSLKAFERFLRENRIEVLYLNNMMIVPYLIPAKKIGCETVVHVREHWPLNEHKKQLNWVRRIVYKDCDSLIAINKYSASIFPKKKATIVYDWIDMSNRYKTFPLDEVFGEDMTDKKVLLYTGGGQYIKGTDMVIKAFSNSVIGNEYRLLILGISEFKPLTGLKHRMKLLLERFGYYYYDKRLRELLEADSRIKCIPGVYELNHIIEQSYCFVSYFRIPHANLAMAENIILGNPCIAADTEEAREYSGGGKYAMLINPLNDQDSFEKGLTAFLANINQWQAVAKEGSYYLTKMFDPTINKARLNAILSKRV